MRKKKHRSFLSRLRKYLLIFVAFVILASLISKAIQIIYLGSIGWATLSFSWLSILLTLLGSLAYLVVSLLEREPTFRKIHIFIAAIAILYGVILLVAKIRELIVGGAT